MRMNNRYANLDDVTNMLFSQMRGETRLPDLGILKCPRCPDRLEALDLEHFVEDGVRYQRVMWMCKGISKGTCTFPIDMPNNVFWTKRTEEQEQAGFIPLPQIHLLPKQYHHLYPMFFDTEGSHELCLLGQIRKKPKKALDTSSNASTVSSHGRRKRKHMHLADTPLIVDDGLSVSGRSETPVSSGCATRGSSECPSPVSSISAASSSCISSSESAAKYANKSTTPPKTRSNNVCSKNVSSVNSSSYSPSQTLLVPATLSDHTTTATNTSLIDQNSSVFTTSKHSLQATSSSISSDMSTGEGSPTILVPTPEVPPATCASSTIVPAAASNIDNSESSHLKPYCNSENNMHLITTINSVDNDIVNSITSIDSSVEPDKVLASPSSVKYCEGNKISLNDSSGQQKLPSPSLTLQTSTARSIIEPSVTNTSASNSTEKMPSDKTILSQMEYEGDQCGEVEAPMRVVVIDDEINHDEIVNIKKKVATDSAKNTSSSSAIDSSIKTVLSNSNSFSQQASSNSTEFKSKAATNTDIPTSSHHSANDFNPDGVLLPKQIRSVRKFVAQTSSSSTPNDSFAMDDEQFVADFAERCGENLKKDKAKKEEMMRASVCCVSDKRGEPSPFEPWMLRRPGMFDKPDWRKPVRLGCGSAWDAFVTNYNLRYNRDSFLKALGEEMRNEGIVCHDATLTVKQQRMMEKVLRSCKELDSEKQLEQLQKTIDLNALREQISNGVGASEVLQNKRAHHPIDSRNRIEQAKECGTSSGSNAEVYQDNQSVAVFKKVCPREVAVKGDETTFEQEVTTAEIKSEETVVYPQSSDMEDAVKEAVQKYVVRYVTEMKSSSRKRPKSTKSQLRSEEQSQEPEGETQDVQTVCPDVERSQLFDNYEDDFFEMENNFEFDF